MRRLVVGLIAVLCSAICGAEAMPTEVTLTTGRVLHNVQVLRWETNRVVLKHSGGADPIAFSLFKSPAPAELPTMRIEFEAAQKAKQKEVAPPPASEPAQKYDGQAFIVTRGAGNYKLGGMVVRVYLKPAAEMREALKWSSSLPKPDAIATLDADGKFSFSAPASGPVTLVAKSKRLAGGHEERYLWITDAADGANRFEPRLSNENLEHEPYSESGAYNSL